MNIKSAVPPVVDGEIAAKGHGFHILSIWAAVALLCHPFAGHCAAGDAVFSNDGQRIYAIGNFENQRTLREINLSDQTVRLNSCSISSKLTPGRGLDQEF